MSAVVEQAWPVVGDAQRPDAAAIVHGQRRPGVEPHACAAADGGGAVGEAWVVEDVGHLHDVGSEDGVGAERLVPW